MLERRSQELELVEKQYGELERGPNLDWFVVKHWPLATGWNRVETPVLTLVPPGYAATPPDNFYTVDDLRLAGGGDPSNTSGFLDHDNRRWRIFSYHVEASDWHPHAEPHRGHNLLTFLDGVRTRLSEVN